MASQGPLFPGSVVGDPMGDHNRLIWDDVNAVKLDDAIVTTCAPSPATYRLTFAFLASNFGFSIPPGSVPTGIEFSFEAGTNITVGGQCRDGTATLLLNGVPVGQILSSGSDWTPGMHVRGIGGPGNMWGWSGATWEDINDANFAIRFDIQVASGNTASVDYIALKVYYSTTTYAAHTGSGGVGVGGRAVVKSAPVTVKGGVGVGGAGLVKSAPVIRGGVGVGGSAPVLKLRLHTASGGVGVGKAAATQQIFSYTGKGGVGVGGYGIVNQLVNFATSGGVGVGGAAARKVIPAIRGGVGVGGAALFHKERTVTPSGGVGVGGAAAGIVHLRFHTPSGGVGAGGSAVVNHTNNVITRGGVGVGGSARIRRFNVNDPPPDDTSDDPEDDIERSHRGPVTRRMVFQAILQALIDGPLDSVRAYISDDEPDMNNVPPGDMFAVVIPGSVSNNQGDLEGGGFIGTMRTDSAQVRVYSTMSLDQVARTTAFNLRVDRGAMERARKIRRTLNLLDLVDPSGWALLSEPMRATTTAPSKPTRVNTKWQFYAETFEVKYTEYLG